MKNGAIRPWDPTSAPSFWINHASRLIMRRFEATLRPLDFGMAYLPVLVALEESDAPLLQKELAERARVEQPTMTALLGRMERDGLVSREPHPTDGRATLISLTPKARGRLPEAREIMRETAEKAVAGFDDQERATILSLLQRVVNNLDEATD